MRLGEPEAGRVFGEERVYGRNIKSVFYDGGGDEDFYLTLPESAHGFYDFFFRHPAVERPRFYFRKKIFDGF